MHEYGTYGIHERPAGKISPFIQEYQRRPLTPKYIQITFNVNKIIPGGF